MTSTQSEVVSSARHSGVGTEGQSVAPRVSSEVCRGCDRWREGVALLVDGWYRKRYCLTCRDKYLTHQERLKVQPWPAR